MPRPYALLDLQYGPATWEPTRRSGHRTDAHRQRLHGKLEPIDEAARPWWRPW